MINEYNVALKEDPIEQFNDWFQEAIESADISLPEACFVATVSTDGYPEGRVLLLKEIDKRGVVFYTNSQSDKGLALAKTPRASLVFHWQPLGYQVRFQGDVEQVEDTKANAYFETRPRQSQIGAWASQQSQERMEPLAKRVKDMKKRFESKRNIPRPKHWNGYRIQPRKIEFWINRPHRLHDRFIYRVSNTGWTIQSVDP